MLKVQHKTRLIILLCGLSFLALFMIILIIIPAIRDMKKLDTEIRGIQNFLEGQYQKTKFLKRSMRELESTSKDVAVFERALIKKNDSLSAITEFEKIAASRNIKQDINLSFSGDIANTQGKPRQENQFYVFSFHNYGKFSDHLNFLADLEKLPFYVVIDSVHFEKKDSVDQNVWLRFSGKVYVHD